MSMRETEDKTRTLSLTQKDAAPTSSPRATATYPNDDAFARKLRGFGPIGIVAALIVLGLGPLFEPWGALVCLLWVWRSRTPWREIGYVKPKSWIGATAVGIVFGFAFKMTMKAVVMRLLGAPDINAAYHFLAGNTAALPGWIFMMIFGAGGGEETVFRGFFFERLGKLFGPSAGAKIAIVLITSVWFGMLHYPIQGWPGAVQSTIMGLLFGTIFMRTGRIFMLMVAHAAFDLTAMGIIYWGLETSVAHLVFR